MIKIIGKNVAFNPNVLHRVEKDETIYDIARTYHINPQVLIKKYGTNLYPGQCLIFCTNKKYHIVKPTETIEKICQQYDISRDELIKKNNITKLFIGQMLEV